MPVHSLGYLRFRSPRLEEWRTFGRDVLGLMCVEEADGAIGFRIDEHPSRLVILPAEEKSVEAMGYQVRDARELAELVEAIEKFGLTVTAGSPEEAAARHVAEFVRFTDPGGTPVELYHCPIRDHVPVVTPHVSGFVTGDMGMGHAVISTPDFPATHAFYTEVLGIRERNYMHSKGRHLWFLSPNPRHHTLHFMLQVRSIDDVGRALDRIEEHGTPMMLTLGRHTNDEMLSFYVYTPDGYAVEYGCEGPRCDEDGPTYAITKSSFWGHRYVGPPPA
jgi:3,4-dihydroxy-9,10-secoandrosta-1,3,5(10)-triene-9,17-dione 4,5-dioxygenase